MQKQLDTPSPYYEGFTKKIREKLKLLFTFEITRIKKIFLFIFFCFDGLKKRKKTRNMPAIFFDCLQVWMLPDREKHWKTQNLINWSESYWKFIQNLFFVLPHWRNIFVILRFVKRYIYICKVYKKKM